jgi:DegV family protein with EDD domain
MFKIISDGACDFTKELAEKHDVHIVPFYVTFDGNTFYKEGVDISNDDYFARLVSDKDTFPKTSQPSPEDYIEAYTPYLEAGQDVLILTISSKLSGSNQSATIAKADLEQKYPDRKILIVDSLSATAGEALLLFELIKLRNKGIDIEAAHAYGIEAAKEAKIYFTLETLEYLQRGGRVGKASALIGGMLNLKPVLSIVDGIANPVAKVRGKKKAMSEIVDIFAKDIEGRKDDLVYGIIHIRNLEEGREFQKELETNLNIPFEEEPIGIGATIGTHVGPGGIGLAFIPKYKG